MRFHRRRGVGVLGCALVLVAGCSGASDVVGADPFRPGVDLPSGAAALGTWTGTVDVRACSGDAAAEPLRCVAPQGALPLALAMCGDLDGDNTLTLDARPGAEGAALVVRGRSRTSAPLRVGGAFTSMLGIEARNTEDVAGPLRTGGDFIVSAPVRVGGDAFVGGVLVADNKVDVAGTLHVGQRVEEVGNVSAGEVVNGPVALPTPVDCEAVPNVAALVDRARQERDDQRGDLLRPMDPPSALAKVDRPTRLTLGCRRYVLDAIGVENDLVIRVEGKTTLVVVNDVRIAGPTRIELAPGASLDLLVGGSVDVDNTLSITGGEGRTWLGIAGRLRIASPTVLEGWLVAPKSEVAADNTFQLRGAAFLRSLRVASPMVVSSGPSISSIGCAIP